MADADNLDLGLVAAEEFADGLRLGLDGTGWGLLNKDVAVLAVLESEEYEVDSLIQAHDEAGHARLSKGDGVAVPYLVYPERDN